MQGKPRSLHCLKFVFNVRLDAVHVRFVLHLQVDHEEDVIPRFMVIGHMMFEAGLSISVELLPCQSTNVAPILHVFGLQRRLLSQLCKGVNNDAKDHVEQDGYHKQEEGHVEEEANVICE